VKGPPQPQQRRHRPRHCGVDPSGQPHHCAIWYTEL